MRARELARPGTKGLVVVLQARDSGCPEHGWLKLEWRGEVGIARCVDQNEASGLKGEGGELMSGNEATT